MAKKRHQNSKKTTNGIGHKKLVKGIIVLFTKESLLKIINDVHVTKAVYGDSALADTMAMDKIIRALAEGKDTVVI